MTTLAPTDPSETAKYRHLIAPHCNGNGVDIGSGGWPVTPYAMQVELPLGDFEYYNSGRRLPPGGYYRAKDGMLNLPFKDGVLDFVYSSHLLEDFADWTPLLREWIRVLRPGGKLIVLIPDDGLWNAAVVNGQPPNCAHRHCGHPGELSAHILAIHPFEVLADHLTDLHPGDYSIVFIGRKT